MSVMLQIPNMALTATTIKVTRFRTLATPCLQRVEKVNRGTYIQSHTLTMVHMCGRIPLGFRVKII